MASIVYPQPAEYLYPEICDRRIWLLNEYNNIRKICRDVCCYYDDKMIPLGIPDNVAKYISIDSLRNLRLPFHSSSDDILFLRQKKKINKSLIYLIDSDLLTFDSKYIQRVKKFVYFNSYRKTVFKFLKSSDNLFDFLMECSLCYNFSHFIGSKRCLAVYTDIMCAEYSYEGPDIHCLANNFNSLPVMCDYKFQEIRLSFLSNISQALVNMCNFATNITSLGLAHCDLKPDNFSYDITTSKIKIIDCEYMFPFCYDKSQHQQLLRMNQCKLYPHIPYEFFIVPLLFSERSTVYGLDFTISTIFSFVYDDKSTSAVVANRKLQIIGKDKYFQHVHERCMSRETELRPTVDEVNLLFRSFI